MLENAADELASHWGNLTYDVNVVVPLPIKNTDEVYNDHNNVEIVCSCHVTYAFSE